MYIYIHKHAHRDHHRLVCIGVYTIYIHMYRCIYNIWYVHIFLYICICIYVYIYVYIYTYIYIYIHIHTHTQKSQQSGEIRWVLEAPLHIYIYIYDIHICIYTHTQTQGSQRTGVIRRVRHCPRVDWVSPPPPPLHLPSLSPTLSVYHQVWR